MRYLRLFLSEFYIEHKKDMLLSITIYLTVSICFFSTFVSLRVLQKNAVIYEDTQKAKCTYFEVTLDLKEYGSVSAAANSVNRLMTDRQASVNDLHFSMSEPPLYKVLDGLGEISDTITVLPDSEFPYEKDRIVCAENILFRGQPVKVGDEIELFGERFTVAETGDITTICSSAFSEFDDSGLENMMLNVSSVVFPEPLSSDELAEVSEILKTIGPLRSDFDIAKESNAEVLADQMLTCLLISALAALIIITLFKQVMKNLISKVAAFKLYGCKNGFVVFFFLCSLCVYVLISFAIAVIAFELCSGVFVKFELPEPISFSLELAALGVSLVLSLIFTLPGTIKIARLMPAKLEIRR